MEDIHRNYDYEVNSDIDMNKEEERSLLRPTRNSRSPRDRFFAVFFIFGFLGLASLLPWNFFITAKAYFDYKFRNTSDHYNASSSKDKDHTTDLQKTFESYLSIVSNGSNLVLMILTTLLVRWISVKKRIIASAIFVTLIFIATTVMVKVNTDSWQDKFLMFTLITAAFMSGGQSVLNGSVLGLSATFPVIYAQVAMIGQAAGGTFSALMSILTLWTGGGPTSSAFTYFLIATVTTVVALLLYVCLHFLPFSQFHMVKNDTSLKDFSPDNLQPETGSKVKFLWGVFKTTWVYCVSAGLVFLVTLSVFPAVCSIIKPMSKEKNPWTEIYFIPVSCFFLFNIGDFLGRLFTFVCTFPGGNRPILFLSMTCMRFAFIPLLMFCNTSSRHLPVVFDNDTFPIVFILLMGLTNGYMGTLCMSFGPIQVDSGKQEAAGLLLALGMTIGLAGGSLLSYVLVKIL